MPTRLPEDFTFNATSRAEVIDDLLAKLIAHYVYADKGVQIADYIRDRHANGAYDALQAPRDFCHALTVDLQQVSRDRHLVVLWQHLDREDSKATEPDNAEPDANAQAANFGFSKVEILPGNIGLIELTGFYDPVHAGDTATAAMRFVSNTHALIFDVRNNPGGDGRMVILLCSYLRPGNQWELSGYYSRKVDLLEPIWTMPYVPGPYYTNKPVYVLTGPHTFSGGELLAYDLQALKWATVVGETTGGAAHGADFHQLPYGCDALISYSAAKNPITNTNWEGVGVRPDVPVPQAEALQTAHRMALQAVLESGQSEAIRERARTTLAQMTKPEHAA